jgi:N-acetylmuramoyl-L-alanine amidase
MSFEVDPQSDSAKSAVRAMVSRRTILSIMAIPLLLLGIFQTGLMSFESLGLFGDSPPRLRVVLDAGHGADEWGATGYGLIERDSNLDMAKRVGALLEQADIDVVYTRTDDGRATDDGRVLWDYSATFADLDSRIAIANEAKADLFISIHSNGYQDPSSRGLEVMYTPGRPFSDRSQALAESIRASIVSVLRTGGYEVGDGVVRVDTDMADSAGRMTPYLVLGAERELTRAEMDERGGDWDALGYGAQTSIKTRATQVPGVLLELFYITNEDDAALLKDDSARHLMAVGIAEAIKSVLVELAKEQ